MLPVHNPRFWVVNWTPLLSRRESGILPARGCGSPVFLSYVANPSWNFLLAIDKSPTLSARLARAYAIEPLISLSNSEVSTTPPRELLRLVIATAIPGEVDTLVGTAAVREGREARMKAREKYISSRTIEHLVGAHLW